MLTSKWSSRKFWTVNFWQAVATVALFSDKLDGGTYSLLSGSLIGTYIVGNVAYKAVNHAVADK